MRSLLRTLTDPAFIAAFLMTSGVAAAAVMTGKVLVRDIERYEARPRCYLVAYQRQGKLWVDPESSVHNSRICVPGAPGSRQVVEAIQEQLQTALRSTSPPAAAVILNILPAGEI